MTTGDPRGLAETRRRVVLVTGLSGAGKSSILRTLEDLGYQAMDNLPLSLLPRLAASESCALAMGIDARARDFSSAALIARLDALRADPALDAQLIFATARRDVLLRRYTETRRRHPLAPETCITDGIDAEIALLGPLKREADWLVDTSELPAPALRALIEVRYRLGDVASTLTVSLVSFAYPAGLPAEADLVFDARFLRNPHYQPTLRKLTGLDPEIGAFIAEDPDFGAFLAQLTAMLRLLLPRFVQEGKRYVTIAIGCTGGRHRSVHVVERLAPPLMQAGWRVTRTHREISAVHAVNPDATPASPENPATGRMAATLPEV